MNVIYNSRNILFSSPIFKVKLPLLTEVSFDQHHEQGFAWISQLKFAPKSSYAWMARNQRRNTFYFPKHIWLDRLHFDSNNLQHIIWQSCQFFLDCQKHVKVEWTKTFGAVIRVQKWPLWVCILAHHHNKNSCHGF